MTTHENGTWPRWLIPLLIVACVASVIVIINREQRGPWYLGCIHRNGDELLLKTDHKPRVEGSLVYIGDDAFVTPEPGMSCRIATVEEIEKKQGLDKPN